MKKVCVLLLVQLLVFETVCYGATSDDVYVRKDVFEAKIEAINAKLDMLLEQTKEIKEEQKAQRADINELTRAVSVLSTRVDGVEKNMNSLDKRIDDLRNGIYLWLVAIGLVIAIIAWPKVQDMLPKWGKATPSITLDDVRRLIEENNARIAGKAQA